MMCVGEEGESKDGWWWWRDDRDGALPICHCQGLSDQLCVGFNASHRHCPSASCLARLATTSSGSRSGLEIPPYRFRLTITFAPHLQCYILVQLTPLQICRTRNRERRASVRTNSANNGCGKAASPARPRMRSQATFQCGATLAGRSPSRAASRAVSKAALSCLGCVASYAPECAYAKSEGWLV